MRADDKERINCSRAGEFGHTLCGVCPDCNAPRFECGHWSDVRR